ncbi:hypothetical protein [Proteiniborus sp.]
MKKKIFMLLSILTILSSFSSIAIAGEINPPPIREESIKIIKQI